MRRSKGGFFYLIISSNNYDTYSSGHAWKYSISYFFSWWIKHSNLQNKHVFAGLAWIGHRTIIFMNSEDERIKEVSKIKEKHTNPINVSSFSSSNERDCWPMGIFFSARAKHLKVSFPAKLKRETSLLIPQIWPLKSWYGPSIRKLLFQMLSLLITILSIDINYYIRW